MKILHKKINYSIILILVTLICSVSVLSQINVPRDNTQCANDTATKFVASKININVIDIDLRDFLLLVGSKIDCVFVVDNSVEKIKISINEKNTSWKSILNKVFQTNGLGMIAKEGIYKASKISKEAKISFLFVSTKKRIDCETSTLSCHSEEKFLDNDENALYTEFVRLKNSPTSEYRTRIKKQNPNTRIGVGYSKIMRKVAKHVSKKGEIEVDCKTGTLIITDKKKNLDKLVRLAKSFDKPENYLLFEKDRKFIIKNYSFCGNTYRCDFIIR